MSMLPQWIIEKKRDGEPLVESEIRDFIQGYTTGLIPDYQMSALAMAIFFNGMSSEETSLLTRAMLESGETVNTSSITRPKIDKHSSGGIGDKVSIVLGPLAAACGLAVPMISGRGLGITGGTLDKLESIPGYRTALSSKEFVDIVGKCGCSITAQTPRIVPADRKLYALRDVTGTVPSIPLIVASIMSKKLAAGLDGLVLDIKCGTGAFMKTHADACSLGSALVEVGRSTGLPTRALVTDMNQPIGRTAGNALEIVESIETLRGNGPEDLVTLTIALCARMLVLARAKRDLATASDYAARTLKSGKALGVFADMLALHGGERGVIDDPSLLPRARVVKPIMAASTGFVSRVDAEKIGKACLVLGAGRRLTTDTVDHAVGVSDMVKVGEHVTAGQSLATLHSNRDDAMFEAEELAAAAFSIAGAAVSTAQPLIIEELTGEDS
jgi:pyrimidine-nucleoside phosphorylase